MGFVAVQLLEAVPPTLDVEDQEPRLKGRVGKGVHWAFSHFYPDDSNGSDLFAQVVCQYFRKDAIVLDAGCGSGQLYPYRWRERVRLLVGCDVGPGLRHNTSVDGAVTSDLAALPFRDESFDLVFSRYVLEHIANPECVVREVARVLRPGGSFVNLTPSKYHYVTAISRFSPHRFHERVGRLRGNQPEDVFPTRYRANSRPQLLRYGAGAGLAVDRYIAKEAPPSYLSWSLPVFLFGVAYERIVNQFAILAPLRVSIVAVFRRPAIIHGTRTRLSATS